jgi:hypothetical protein
LRAGSARKQTTIIFPVLNLLPCAPQARSPISVLLEFLWVELLIALHFSIDEAMCKFAVDRSTRKAAQACAHGSAA